MSLLTRHVLLPALAPATTVALYFTPVLWFGCVNRGLLAIAVVLTSAAGAFAAIARGFRAKSRREPIDWWLLTALILTIPLALIIGLG
jgi:hypothetical protein